MVDSDMQQQQQQQQQANKTINTVDATNNKLALFLCDAAAEQKLQLLFVQSTNQQQQQAKALNPTERKKKPAAVARLQRQIKQKLLRLELDFDVRPFPLRKLKALSKQNNFGVGVVFDFVSRQILTWQNLTWWILTCNNNNNNNNNKPAT